MSDLLTLGSTIRRRRNQLGMSLRALSRLTGTSISHLSDIERGINDPGVRVIVRIAAALGMTLDDLIRLAPTAPEEIVTYLGGYEVTRPHWQVLIGVLQALGATRDTREDSTS